MSTSFQANPGAIAGVIIDSLAAVGAVILIGFTFAKAQPFTKASGSGRTAYGWRWALIAWFLAVLLGALAYGLPNGVSLTANFYIIDVFLQLLELIVDCMIIFAIARISSHPARTAAQGTSRDLWSWILLGIAIFTSIVVFGAEANATATYINYVNSDSTTLQSSNNVNYAYLVLNAALMMYTVVQLLISGALLGLAIVAYRRANAAAMSGSGDPMASRAPRFMIIAAAFFMGRALANVAIQSFYLATTVQPYNSETVNYPALTAVGELFEQFPYIIVFTVLLLVFEKPKMQNVQYVYAAPGYAPHQGYAPQGYAPQGYAPYQGQQAYAPYQGQQPVMMAYPNAGGYPVQYLAVPQQQQQQQQQQQPHPQPHQPPVEVAGSGAANMHQSTSARDATLPPSSPSSQSQSQHHSYSQSQNQHQSQQSQSSAELSGNMPMQQRHASPPVPELTHLAGRGGKPSAPIDYETAGIAVGETSRGWGKPGR